MSLKVHELRLIQEPVGYSRIYSEFLSEANMFADYINDGDFEKILLDFNDFNRYLKVRTKKIKANTKVAALTKGTNILSAKNASGELKTILSYAHISACCELLNGWTFNCNHDIKKDLPAFLEQNLTHLKSADEETINKIYLRIATADTVRIIVLLKLLGLLQQDTSKKRVLSYGAASGVKELYATHTVPRIESNIKNLGQYKFQLKFTRTLQWPKQTVLIDYDKFWETHYKNLLSEHPANVLGILNEFDNAITDLPQTLLEHNMEPADLVFGWRIDHQVIPDIPAFFKSLVPSLSTKSKVDFVITIGAGDDDEDFAGRVRTMDKVWAFLKEHKLNPVRIVLYDGGRDFPLFGHGSYATYEVIHCQLDKKKMKQFM